MELLRRDKGPNLGHRVAYYDGSDKVWSSMFVFPDAIKNGDTALLAHGMTIYDYMYKIDTPEYDRVKATTENLVQEVGSRQKMCELAHYYDRALTWSCSVRSQAFSPCTPGVGVYGSWTSGEERVSFCLAYLNYQDVITSTGFYLISRMLLNVPKSSQQTERGFLIIE